MTGTPDQLNQAADHCPPTILVVEDEVLVRLIIADYLRECGYHVIEASTGDEARAIIEARHPIDLVFTDVQMPGTLDGFALAQWGRRERPGMKVVLTSGGAKAAEAARELCADGPLMPKPYAFEHVGQRIRHLLGR